VIDLPDGRRWARWNETIPDVCPACGLAWTEHRRSIEIWAHDGHLGHVLPECPESRGPDTS